MDIFVSIGQRLREERERVGRSQTDIADAVAAAGVAGATRQSQSMYEKGKRMPDAAYLAVIAGLGLDVAYVITGQRSQTTPPAPPQELTRREAMLLNNYRNSSSVAQDAMDKTCAAFAQPVVSIERKATGTGG